MVEGPRVTTEGQRIFDINSITSEELNRLMDLPLEALDQEYRFGHQEAERRMTTATVAMTVIRQTATRFISRLPVWPAPRSKQTVEERVPADVAASVAWLTNHDKVGRGDAAMTE